MARRKRDYYDVLGVSRTASDADLKRAFRELARRFHPDVNASDEGERFREINEAYAVLSDKEARARYDRWGHADDSGGGLSAVVDAAQEIINDMFRRRRGKQKGKDARYTLEVTFEEAAFGVSKTIALGGEATGGPYLNDANGEWEEFRVRSRMPVDAVFMTPGGRITVSSPDHEAKVDVR